MAKKRTSLSYYHINLYNEFKQEYIDRMYDFTLEETTYTKKITIGEERKFFNSKGGSDNKGVILINQTRNDARNYLEHLSICDEKEELIKDEHINFYRLFEKPTEKQQIVKVDLKSAYWKYALKRGIVTEKTNDLFKRLYRNSDNSEAKKARLRALGSLATQKHYLEYKNGKPDYDTEKLIIEPTKALYLEICRGIDDIMNECHYQVKGVYYYYWDCIFIHKDFSDDAIEFFKSFGYNVNVDEDRIEFVEHKGSSFIVSSTNDKCYMVREEDKHLAEWLKKEQSFNEGFLVTEFH